MRRSFILFLIYIVGTCTLSAQNFVMRIGGGLASHCDSETRNIGAFRIGLAYEVELNGLWSIEPGLYYSAKGWKEKDRAVIIYDADSQPVTDEDGNIQTGLMGVTCNTNYLTLPVLLNRYISLPHRHFLSIGAGPYVAYGIGGKSKTSGDTEQTGAARFYHEHATFSRPDMHRFDAGIQLATNYELQRRVLVGLSAAFGITKVSTNGGRNLDVTFNVAYKL